MSNQMSEKQKICYGSESYFFIPYFPLVETTSIFYLLSDPIFRLQELRFSHFDYDTGKQTHCYFNLIMCCK